MKRHLANTVISVALAVLPVFVSLPLRRLVPAVEPALWLTIPSGVALGYGYLWRNYPKHAFPIGVVYIPSIAAALAYIAFLIGWYFEGNYL